MEKFTDDDQNSPLNTPIISPISPTYFTSISDSSVLINPYNIPFYQYIKQLINEIPEENSVKIKHYQRILESLLKYPLPLCEVTDFLWLNGIDVQTAENLIKVIDVDDESCKNVLEFKKQCLTEVRRFCKLLLSSKRQVKPLNVSLQPTLQISQLNNIESYKRLYTPPNGSSSWTALIILFILHTNTEITKFRLSVLVNLSDILLKIIPCTKVDVSSLSKLIKSNLVTFRNEFFITKKSKNNNSIDKPKRFMSKLADMYTYSITDDGLSVGRNLIVKVRVPIQTLIETILSSYNISIEDKSRLNNLNTLSLPRSIKSPINNIIVNKPSEYDSLVIKSNEFDDNNQDSKLEDIDSTIKRSLDSSGDSISLDDSLSLKTRRSDIISTIPNLDVFLESIISKCESDNLSDDNYRLNLSPTNLPDYNISISDNDNDLNNSDTFDDGNYHLVVVIDNREFGGARLKYYDLLIDILKGENIKYKIFTLPLGDIIWVCHRQSIDLSKPKNSAKTGPFVGGETYVLNWIIERKTASDLHSSILDGRYDEQRQRLLESGMKQIIYLYESCIDNLDTSPPGGYWKKHVNPKIFSSAKLNIQFINGFNVINTSSPSHTAAFIVRFHRQLESLICDRSGVKSFKQMTENDNERLSLWLKNPENCCAWHNWVVQSRKDYNITYKHIFGKQLRCIPTCGPIAIAAILSKWPTPIELAAALAEDEDALSSLIVGKKKFIGKKLAQHILKLYRLRN